mmetsp:Transcript_1777/g.2351  ORF Transcript_1777/g.2351 Transcript_1777/m.2351 type:complete len:234 (+) Transcript_1777:79-780(+)
MLKKLIPLALMLKVTCGFIALNHHCKSNRNKLSKRECVNSNNSVFYGNNNGCSNNGGVSGGGGGGDSNDDDDESVPMLLFAYSFAEQFDGKSNSFGGFSDFLNSVLSELEVPDKSSNETHIFSKCLNLLLLGLAQGFIVRAISRLSLASGFGILGASYLLYKWSSNRNYVYIYKDQIESDFRSFIGLGRYSNHPIFSNKALGSAFSEIENRAKRSPVATIVFVLGLAIGFSNG